VGSTR